MEPNYENNAKLESRSYPDTTFEHSTLKENFNYYYLQNTCETC